VTQYAPDVICLQEVDHFADFFSPELMRLGYMGLHAPKPQSIGTRADGCALFVKTSRLSMLSCSVFTYAIPDPQNQVAVLGLCKVMRGEENEPVHVILATTHLKAAKDLRGERCRCKQAEQLLSRLEQVRACYCETTND
jgi:nocturnin